MKVQLTEVAIDAALPRVAAGLAQYGWLQARLMVGDVRTDAEFRRRFNAFLRVRRNRRWKDGFYALMERKKNEPVSFAEVLAALHRRTGQYEASFASKLV